MRRSPLFVPVFAVAVTVCVCNLPSALARQTGAPPSGPQSLPIAPPPPRMPPAPVLPSLVPIPSPQPSAPPPSSRARTATRVLHAVLISVDAAARTLQLREDGEGGGGIGGGTGRTFAIWADPAAKYNKRGAKNGAGLADFVPGEAVVARVTFRTVATPSGAEEVGLLRELWDAASYEAERRERRDTCAGTVASWGRTGDSVAVRRASDGEIVTFRVTTKTAIYRGERVVLPSAYPVGAPVAIKPRALPSGDLMASIIAETERDVLAAYQDGLSTWAGEAAALDEQAQTLTLRRDDSAVRTIALVSLAIVKRGRYVVTPPRAIVGQHVRVHLQKGAERGGLRVADSVTVPTRKGKSDDRGYVER